MTKSVPVFETSFPKMMEEQADDGVDDDWGEADALAMQVPQDMTSTSAGQAPAPTGSDGGSGDLPKPTNEPAESRPMAQHERGSPSGITPDDRLLAKLRADASNTCTNLVQSPADSNHRHEELARTYRDHNRSEGSISLGTVGDGVAETPDDRLAAKLRREINNDSSTSSSTGNTARFVTAGGSSSSVNYSTPDDRLGAKLCSSNNSQRLDETPDDRLSAKVLGTGGGATGSMNDAGNRSLRLGDIALPDRGATNSSNGLHTSGAGSHNMSKSQKLSESAEVGIGAFAVRGVEAAEYEEGRRSSRVTDDDDDDDDNNESLSDGILDAVVTVPCEQEQNKSRWANRKAMITLGICAVVILIAASVGAALAMRPSSTQECQLIELPKKSDHAFGVGLTVAISGDTIIVGAPDSPSGKGSVHVYDRNGKGTWTKLPTVLTPSSSFSGDMFGKAVDIYNDTIVVGAMMEYKLLPGQPTKVIGCAYVFSREKDRSWVERARLLAKIPSRSDQSFASAVAIHGDSILVAEPNKIISIETERDPVADKDIDSDYVGTIYFFERNVTEWILSQQHRRFSAGFGISVGIHAEIAVVGAEEKAYIFRKKQDKKWHLDSTLVTAEGSLSFGTSVAVSPRLVVVGDSGNDDIATHLGKAFVFANNGGTFEENTQISPSNRTSSAGFGTSVGVYKNQIIVSSDGNVGRVYLFKQDSVGNWTERYEGFPSDDTIGSSVAIYGDTAVVSTSHQVYTFDTSANC